MADIRKNYSRNILLRIVVLLILAIGLISFYNDILKQIYFNNQLTDLGLVVNSGIFLLFFIGTGRIAQILFQYQGEERALSRFIDALKQGEGDPTAAISEKALITQRYQTMNELQLNSAPVNHSALASMLKASEGVRLSLPRFINNILILTGVFGTIVSLSIALVGASNLLDSVLEMGNMGMVIHGMSTALSTTITAIVCYLFFGYFYMKLSDAQVHLLSTIEQVTSLQLMSRFGNSPDTLMQNVSGLVQGLRQVAEGMQITQREFQKSSVELHQLLEQMNQRIAPLEESVVDITAILREGFRLPPKQE